MRSENICWIHGTTCIFIKEFSCFVVRVVLGSGLTAEASSDGFYIDLSPPVFDKNVMTQIYIDVTQGEFTPVKYQASNDTIKAYWYCFDEESLIKVIITVYWLSSFRGEDFF
jgi:hypothetical protein